MDIFLPTSCLPFKEYPLKFYTNDKQKSRLNSHHSVGNKALLFVSIPLSVFLENPCLKSLNMFPSKKGFCIFLFRTKFFGLLSRSNRLKIADFCVCIYFRRRERRRSVFQEVYRSSLERLHSRRCGSLYYDVVVFSDPLHGHVLYC